MVIYGIYEWIKRRRRENLHSIARLCSERVYTISASNSTCHTAGETADTLIPYNSICPREGQIFSPVHNGLCTSDSRNASLGWLTSWLNSYELTETSNRNTVQYFVLTSGNGQYSIVCHSSAVWRGSGIGLFSGRWMQTNCTCVGLSPPPIHTHTHTCLELLSLLWTALGPFLTSLRCLGSALLSLACLGAFAHCVGDSCYLFASFFSLLFFSLFILGARQLFKSGMSCCVGCCQLFWEGGWVGGRGFTGVWRTGAVLFSGGSRYVEVSSYHRLLSVVCQGRLGLHAETERAAACQCCAMSAEQCTEDTLSADH